MATGVGRRLKRAVRHVRARLPRIAAPGGPILVNSVPKCGTNLLRNVIRAVPGVVECGDLSSAARVRDEDDRLELVKRRIWCTRPPCLYVGHIPFSTRIAEWIGEQGFKHIFLVRDPRDMTVSHAHYLAHHNRHAVVSAMPAGDRRLLAAIEGIGRGREAYFAPPESVSNVRSIFDAYLGWLKWPGVLTVRFEDLVDRDARATPGGVMATLLRFLEMPISTRTMRRMERRGAAPRRSRTFRSGRTGSWREEYTPQHVDAFRRVAGGLLERLGYPPAM